MKFKIIRNIIRFKHCLDTIESVDVYDIKTCSCGKVGVDGGTEYLKRLGVVDDYEELSIMNEM
ncbi:hypothetical protein D7Z26_12120 [Cohnella endophytica]|uniref:DUF7695 domain-containing protein n=1 Tax=Cohnella endophytica TaxID=2419778 RepID=A0A494XU14_9BACL|nr:hypothetical protein [Cohnella endophytica]RKP54123.1 hypothetical protein D7Z26_12120 [Cohnella endophytica]